MSIRLKLIVVFLAIAIIPILTIGIISYSVARNALMNARLDALESIADIKANSIKSFFNERKADARTIQDYYNIKTNLPIVTQFANDRTNPAYIKAKKMLDGQLQTFQTVYKYEDFMLVDPEGKIVYVTNETHTEAYLDNLLSELEASVFEEGKKGIYFSDIFYSRYPEDTYLMLITAPINDFYGNFAGIVAIEVDMESIYKLIQETTGLGKTGETLIGKNVGSSALFLNHLRHVRDSALKKKVDFGAKTAFPIQEAVQGRSGSGLSIDYRGQEILAAWRFIPSLGWGLVAKIDTGEAFALVDYLRNMSIVIVGAFMAITIIVGLIFAKIFSGPIIGLTRKTKLIAGGDLTPKLNITTKDEVGQLAISFNTMVHSLKQAQDELVKKEKLATLGRVSGSIAHDIRHPLSTIKNSAYFLNMTLKDPDEMTKKHLNLMNSEITRANEIITSLMRLAGLKKPEKSRININDLVNDFFSEFPLPEWIQLITGLDNQCPDIMIDCLQFRQVCANIMSNAVHAIPNSGTVTVNTRKVQSSEHEGDFVEISFADTGNGMKKEVIEKIFEPFFTMKTSGIGMGLSIVKEIITANDGNITVESEEGKGSTFKIVFPGVEDL